MPTIYLIPSFIAEPDLSVLPAQIVEAVKQCQAFFVENERSARRFLKSIWKDMVIDEYQWVLADKATVEQAPTLSEFRKLIREGKNIGIISEAGCPGIADPGQKLVAAAHAAGATVKPLVGPSSILLALMASGMNGQQFCFAGYLPIDNGQRIKNLRDMEMDSAKNSRTQVFMETPYRNNQLLESILKACKPSTRLCIAANITAANESIHTKSLEQWKKAIPDLHKQPVIFCLMAENDK